MRENEECGHSEWKTQEHVHDEEKIAHSIAGSASTSHELDLSDGHQLERGLKSRYIQFLALGGAIGTGLFVGFGAILSTVGPAPLFMAYLSMMFVVWIVMNDLAEMVTYLPLKGISIPYFVNRFVESSLAFGDGWNYWYAYAILVAAEATAGAIIIEYWTASVSAGVWIAVILVVILLLNIVEVAFFGEAEFCFASIKLITILGLIILGVVLFFGGGPSHDRLGFRYWTYQDEYGAFKEYMAPGNTGKFLAYWTAFVRAGFAFITSPELIALAAGETVAPRRNIPKAAKRFVLLGASNASASPFVIGIQNAGIEGLNHVINAAILTSAWSAGNAFCYSGSRILYSLALSNQAPAIFKRTTRFGVPNTSTISGFIAWIVALITYIRFRQAMIFNKMLDVLPFRTPLQPYASYFMVFLISLLPLTNGFQVFFPSEWNVSNFLAAYVTLPIFLALYLGHKAYFTTMYVVKERSWNGSFRPWEMTKAWFGAWKFAHELNEIDVLTGKREMDELEHMDEPPLPRSFIQKCWYWLS
ncbi:hypothetical protein AC578_3182 [Pseudocercospora eumusae]|uniref:Amino acid permease/ SLC12A domain-containing protein n=1 Tax=Pseudocercospora eumusae TaxID=321146 RepID=A0A139GU28_9PEZI|nr:hypothetical protein AC578_3182 [Pseudocercospora eumusae]